MMGPEKGKKMGVLVGGYLLDACNARHGTSKSQYRELRWCATTRRKKNGQGWEPDHCTYAPITGTFFSRRGVLGKGKKYTNEGIPMRQKGAPMGGISWTTGKRRWTNYLTAP